MNVEVAEAIERDGFYVRWRQVMERTTVHHQPGVEVDLMLSGAAAVVVEGRRVSVRGGEVAMFDATGAHAIVSEAGGRFRRTAVCFGPGWAGKVGEVIDGGGAEVVRRRLGRDGLERLDRLASQVYEEQTLRGTGWRQMAEGMLDQWLVVLRREVAVGGLDAASAASGRLVAAARRYVEDHLDRSLTLDVVAGRFGISNEHLTRQFRAELGVPFHQYVLRRRITEARRLLAEASDLTITRIARRVGFGSLSSFSRAFGRMTGDSPRAYRRRANASP